MSDKDKKKVYVETSVISYLTARPSHDLIKNARQLATQDWWQVAPAQFDLHISSLVEREAAKGDPEAAVRRMNALKGIPDLPITEEILALAESGSQNQF